MMISRHGFSLLGATLLTLGGCGAGTPSTCGDDVLDTGEACLVEHDASLDEPLLAVGDVDGDGRTDAVVIVDRNARRVAVRRGEADGSFGPAGPGMIAPALPTLAAVGDADGDGASEVLSWWPTSDDAGEICGHALEPGGTLTSRWCHAALEPAMGSRLEIGALGAAGEAGLAAWARGQAQVLIDPAGAATETWLDLPITKDGTIPLQVADLDGDGRDALLWIAEARLEQHEAPWGAPASTAVPEALVEAVVADYDGDGIDDVALVSPQCTGASAVEVRLSGGPTVAGTRGGPLGCTTYGAGDLDGDGRAELLAATESGLAVWWGQALAGDASVEAVVIEGPVLEGWQGLVVGDVDGDALVDPMITAGDDVAWESGYLPRWIATVWIGEP